METTVKTVKVSETTHARLEKLGVKGETFDVIITDLLNQAEHLKQILNLIDKAAVAFESSKADFRNIFSQLVAVAKAR
jgi:hypothetical protein